MASGIYAQRTTQKPIAMRQQGVTFAVTRGSRISAIVHPSVRWRPWMLYPIGAACLLMVVLSTGILSQHPTASYVATGGQSYSIQVGGDMAGSWQHDQTATTPTPQPQATPMPQSSAAP